MIHKGPGSAMTPLSYLCFYGVEEFYDILTVWTTVDDLYIRGCDN
jgi:hypothetical protein